MRRRHYLAATTSGLSLALAGCTGQIQDAGTTNSDAETGTSVNSGAPTAEQQGQETTREPVGGPNVTIGESTIRTDDSGYQTEKYVDVTVFNDGDVPSGQVELTVRWYDDNGDLLDDSRQFLPTLGAGETWLARVRALTTEPAEIADYEVDGQYETQPPQAPENVELLESDFEVGGDGGVTVTGRAENNTGGELSYLEAVGKLYDADGRVLAGEFTNETEIPAGETWRFNVEWIQFDRIGQIDSYEALLDDSAF